MSPESTTAEQNESSWWLRPCGGRELLIIALPLVISSLSWTVMTFVDRVFLSQESGEAMSAAFSAGTVWFLVLCLPLGICSYVNTFVSQYFGAGQPHRIGPAVWQGVWIALLFTPLLVLAIPAARPLFEMAEHGAEITRQEILYFQILTWGGPAMLLAQAFACFYSGRGQTQVVMVVDASFAGLNLVLDYFLIFGFDIPGVGNCPALGIAGAAWATVISLWLKAFTYGWLMLRKPNRERFGTLAGLRIDGPLFRRLLYFGGPSGLQMVLDVAGFTVFILLAGRLGVVASEATTMAFSISTLAFMPVWGLGMAVGIVVGQQLGDNRDDLAERATWTGLVIGLTYMIGMSLLYVFAPDLFLSSFFIGEGDPEQNQQVYSLAVTLLWFVAAYNLLDAVLMVFVNALKGAGDTTFILMVSIVMAVLLCVLSYVAVEVWHLGVYGCWALITGWIWICGVVFLIRFRGGVWRHMRVIEEPLPELVAVEG